MNTLIILLAALLAGTPAAEAPPGLGAVLPDAELQALGETLALFSDQADPRPLRFARLDSGRPVALALPSGDILVSDTVLQRLAGQQGQVGFLVSTLAALVLDGRTQRDPQVAALLAKPDGGRPSEALVAAVEHTYTRARVLEADRMGLLLLVRGGMSPLAGVRALEALAALGVDNLCASKAAVDMPTLNERRLLAQQSAADLARTVNDFDLGVSDLSHGRYAEAARNFQAYLRLMPNSFAAWNDLGLAWQHQSVAQCGPLDFLLADALADENTSFITRGPDRTPDRELWQKADAAYQRAAELGPRRVEPRCNRGALHVLSEDWRTARGELAQALERAPRHAPSLNNLGVVLAEPRPQEPPVEAQRQFAAAAEADPLLPAAQFNLGRCLRRRGQADWRRPLERYLALSPRGAMAEQAFGELERTPPKPTPGSKATQARLVLRPGLDLSLPLTRAALTRQIGEAPDQVSEHAGTVRAVAWSRLGLAAELVDGEVLQLQAGPPSAAQTADGVRLGDTAQALQQRYGAPAVSREQPYEVWRYHSAGVAFLICGQRVHKILLLASVG